MVAFTLAFLARAFTAFVMTIIPTAHVLISLTGGLSLAVAPISYYYVYTLLL